LLETPEDELVASQTLKLLPATIPVKRVTSSRTGPTADLAAICEGFYIVEAAGNFQGIEPGRPGVPSFGRKLYHANAFRSIGGATDIPKWKVRAIERKASESIERLTSEKRLAFWLDSLEGVLHELTATRFCGLVVDYDGTLCSEDHRFDPLPKEMAAALTGLLKAGLVLGVATGRGKSVRERLREAIPKKYWSQISVGYYNGGQILSLQSDAAPDGTEHVVRELEPIAAALQADRVLAGGEITLRDRQIVVSKVPGLTIQTLCAYSESIANRISPSGVRVTRSGHSVDIVPQSVSKLAVVESVRALAGIANAAVLRIGDRGLYPGNDSQLLASPHGLSAFEVSPDPTTCWNIARPGHRGEQATLDYLKRLKVAKKGIRFQLPTVEGGKP
jgi:hydroxymethylpyrimidine pyrophosphatase-like HAD family hydrolase